MQISQHLYKNDYDQEKPKLTTETMLRKNEMKNKLKTGERFQALTCFKNRQFQLMR